MDSQQHPIDVQFNRAVEIVQGLPKTGPIQTGYEDKLNMYRQVHEGVRPPFSRMLTSSQRICSLYKQGNLS